MEVSKRGRVEEAPRPITPPVSPISVYSLGRVYPRLHHVRNPRERPDNNRSPRINFRRSNERSSDYSLSTDFFPSLIFQKRCSWKWNPVDLCRPGSFTLKQFLVDVEVRFLRGFEDSSVRLPRGPFGYWFLQDSNRFARLDVCSPAVLISTGNRTGNCTWWTL